MAKKPVIFGILMSLVIMAALSVSGYVILKFSHKPALLKPSGSLKDWGDLIGDKFNPGGMLLPNVNEMVQGVYKNQPVRWVTNSQGFRNQREFSQVPKPGVLRILYIGDSFVTGYRLGQEHLSGAVMEQEIRSQLPAEEFQDVEVMVCCAMDPFEARRYFNLYGAAYRPHIVILGICLGNDIGAAGFRQYRAKELGDDKEASQSIESEFRDTFAKLPLPQDAYSAKPLTVIYGFNDTFLQPGIYYQPTLPETELLFSNFEEVLLGFAQDVEKQKIKFIAAIFPLREQIYFGVWKKQYEYFHLNPDKFDLSYSTRRLGNFFKKERIDSLTLLPFFLYVMQSSRAMLYFPEDTMHWNAEGNALAGKVMAINILERLRFLTLPPGDPDRLNRPGSEGR